MAKYKANEEGKIGGFELIPEGERMFEIEDLVMVEDKETKQANPLKMMFKLVSGEYNMAQFIQADKPKSLEAFLTILHVSGIAKKLAEKNASKYGANPIKEGWDDSVFLTKEGDKVTGFETKFVTGVKICMKGCKFMGEVKHTASRKNKEDIFANLGKVWAYNPNSSNVPVGAGAGAKAEDEDF